MNIFQKIITATKQFKQINFYKIEYLFLIIAISWGLIQVFLMPPFQVADETSHFYRAWGLSEGQILCNKNLQVNIPQNVISLSPNLNVTEINNGLYSPEILDKFWAEKIAAEKHRAFTQFCAYNPIGYIPQSAGIAISRLLNLSPLHSFYFGRIFNLFISVIVIFWAIKLAPFGKIIFLFTALFPMAVHQMASLSNDALVISGLLLFTSVILYFSQKKRISNKELTLIIIASALLSQIKPGYIGFIFLPLIILPKKFGSWKNIFYFY